MNKQQIEDKLKLIEERLTHAEQILSKMLELHPKKAPVRSEFVDYANIHELRGK